MFLRSICSTKNRGRARTIFPTPQKQCDRRRQGERKKDEKGRKETAGRGIDAAERANLRENLCTDIIFYITAHAA